MAKQIKGKSGTTYIIEDGGGLSRAQIEEVKAEQVSNGVPVRFMRGGEAINIVTGEGSCDEGSHPVPDRVGTL